MKQLVASVVFVMSLSLNAEDGFDDEGFDDSIIEIEVNDVVDAKAILYGSIDLEAHYNINNDKDLSSLKTLVDVIGEYKLDNGNNIKGDLKAYHDFVFDTGLSNYTSTPSGYKDEINLNELSIEGSINPTLDFKIGRQIVVWGKSDSIRVTDILNPLDNRTPGLVDIKNLRLGRVMSKLDYYANKLNFSAIAIHEHRFTKNAAYGSDFKTTVDKSSNTPSDSIDNTGIALSLTGAFEGYDLGVYFADIYIDKAYLENDILQYDNKSKMLGLAYNQAIDNYLLKFETAHFDQIKYNGIADTKARTDVLLGVEYNGITDGSLGYEVALRKIHDYSDAINVQSNGYKPEKEYQQVLRFNQTYLNQALEFNAVVNVFGDKAQDGGSARVSFDYALDDQTSVSGGIIDYIGGDNAAIDAYKDNDRIFAKMSYLF